MPFQKGVSGNPGGRPKKALSLTGILAAQLEKKGPDGQRNKDAIVQKLIQLARSGDRYAAEFIIERIDGKLTQPIEHSGSITDGAYERIAGRLAGLVATGSLPDGDPVEATNGHKRNGRGHT